MAKRKQAFGNHEAALSMETNSQAADCQCADCQSAHRHYANCNPADRQSSNTATGRRQQSRADPSDGNAAARNRAHGDNAPGKRQSDRDHARRHIANRHDAVCLARLLSLLDVRPDCYRNDGYAPQFRTRPLANGIRHAQLTMSAEGSTRLARIAMSDR
jgi:hypothetical protein